MAINSVLIFCCRRFGHTLVATESAPQQKGLARVLYVPENDDTGYVVDEQAITSTESMRLRRAMADERLQEHGYRQRKTACLP
ncbi:hypothetical protein LY78DRAFT_78923 [Colletotrichum sublineola]|nr:hypothetical protein LY78DRAFT_78923 [Colletotrichum sublineola]